MSKQKNLSCHDIADHIKQIRQPQNSHHPVINCLLPAGGQRAVPGPKETSGRRSRRDLRSVAG
ncbi:MAG: hypothetical protein R6V15_10495, partial [Desulfotignum sp.]